MSESTSSGSDEPRRTRRFMALYARHARWLYAYLFSVVRNEADAEDLLSETTATLWEKFDEYDPATEFRAWSCRVAQYKVLEWRKRMRRVPGPGGDAFLEAVTQAYTSRSPELDRTAERLEDCVGELNEEDRDALTRRYAPGASVAKVAAALGHSIHKVYRNLRRIHDLLFRCIHRKMSEEGDA